MKTGVWKGKHSVTVYETQEDGKKVFIIEFSSGTSITSTTDEEITYD